jgi:hypothetical protein
MFSQAVALYETFVSRRRLRRDPELRRDIDQWCAAELAPWRHQCPGEGAALLALNRTHPWLFVFVINKFGVRRVEKPRICASAGPVAEQRAQFYQAALARVVQRIEVSREIMIAIDVNDGPMPADNVPIFSFQKPRGSRNILLPDVDFFPGVASSLPSWLHFDRNRWSGKQHRAIFAGSTSGGAITADSLRNAPIPRLQSAAAFRDRPEVEFQLPGLAGCASAEAEAALRAMGHGRATVSWATQLQYRFIISMDGNGATCSRLPIILRSHSVLLKYDSPHALFYFRGLKPWLHYVPIANDADVLAVIEDARRDPARYRAIAKAGRGFRRRYLTQWMVDYYLERLVSLYLRRETIPLRSRKYAPSRELALTT